LTGTYFKKSKKEEK
jgi:hypothetical protein